MRTYQYFAAAAVCALVPNAAFAQDTTSSAGGSASFNNDEIVVTAQKRTESAQDVPISLTVLSEASLERSAIDNVLDLPRIAPGFTASRAAQTANTRLSIRGIGSSGNSSIEPSVGAFVDGIYIPRPGPLLASLNDIANVEILRGPQGTLFGRNATAGAISFNTNDPNDEFEALLSGEYGSYDRRRLTGILNVPVSEGFALRGSALFEELDGYGRNVDTRGRYGATKVSSFRLAGKAELMPSLTWTLKGDYQAQRGDGVASISVVAETVTPAARTNFITRTGDQTPLLDDTYTFLNRADTDGVLNDDQWGLASDLELELGEYTVRLLSGYRDWDYKQSEDDITQTPNSYYGRDASFRSRSHSQELQLISPKEAFGGRVNFVAGLYYFRERYQIGEQVNLGTEFCSEIIARAAPTRLAACNTGPKVRASVFDFNQVTESLATYGQATFAITDTLDVTGGIRYSHDSKTGDLTSILLNSANITRAADTALGLKFDGGKLTYRLNASYRPTSDLMFFVSHSTGYKSGGFDSGNGATLGLNRLFRPETTTNYEIGAKTEFLNRKVTANATLFRMDIDDFQLRSFNGQTFSVRNAGSLRQQGAEFEVTARPVEGLSLGVSAVRLGSQYTEFAGAPGLPGFGGTQNLTGARVPNSPEWQGTMSGSYSGALTGSVSFSLSSNLSFQSASDVGGAGDNNPQGIEPAYELLGARFSVFDVDEAWEFYLSGENLTDQGYCTIRFSQVLNGPLGLNNAVTGGSVQRCILGSPREIRVGAKFRF